MSLQPPNNPWTTDETWLDELVAQSTSPLTIKSYRSDIRLYLDWVRVSGLASPFVADKGTIEGFLIELRTSGRGQSSIRVSHSAIRSYYKFAINCGWTDKNPARDVPRLVVSEKPLEVLSVEQTIRLLDCTHERAREARPGSIKAVSFARTAAMLETMYSGGFSVSDLCALPASVLDHGPGVVDVKAPTGEMQPRIINRRAIDAISIWRASMEKYGAASEEWLFHAVRNPSQPVTRQQLHKDCQDAARYAGLPSTNSVSPITLKESLVVHLLQRGMPVSHLAQMFGYTELISIKRFVQVAVEASPPLLPTETPT